MGDQMQRSVAGHFRKSGFVTGTSALPSGADVVRTHAQVRFVPHPDSCTAAKGSLFDHRVGTCDQSGRYFEAKRLSLIRSPRPPKLTVTEEW